MPLHDIHKKRRKKNVILLMMLIGLIAILYTLTIVKMGSVS